MTYVFDHAWEQERDRLAGLEWALDPGTVRRLDDLGVGPGWRCLEIGAGAGSIAAWLTDRVGTDGRVVATDLETAFLERAAADHPCLEVLRHDITAEPLPASGFDLVHARWMLHWLADPDAAVAAMASALRPGGWLVVEEPDAAAFVHSSEPDVLRRVGIAWLATLAELSGVTLDLGRRLPALLRTAGLVGVDGEGRIPLLAGASPLARFLRLGIDKVRPAVLAGGCVEDAEIDEVYRLLEDPNFSTLFVATVAACGRRP